MCRFQFNIRSLLAASTFTAIFGAAICGAFGEGIESAVTEVTLFVTLAIAWLALQVAVYAAVVVPLLAIWLIAHRIRSSDSLE